MSNDRKRLEKERRREHARGVERQRRIDADRCAEWMWQAQWAWERHDLEAAKRLLEKVLRLRPKHAEARERLAGACFQLNQPAEGLGHYERFPKRRACRRSRTTPPWRRGGWGGSSGARSC